jgi:toxin ParE1/3/4
MKVRYSEAAAADLRYILAFLTDVNPTAAARVGQAIEITVKRISEFPDSAQATDQPPIRMAPAGRFPYLIFYTKAETEVQIVRVLHGARLRPWEQDEGK